MICPEHIVFIARQSLETVAENREIICRLIKHDCRLAAKPVQYHVFFELIAFESCINFNACKHFFFWEIDIFRVSIYFGDRSFRAFFADANFCWHDIDHIHMTIYKPL